MHCSIICLRSSCMHSQLCSGVSHYGFSHILHPSPPPNVGKTRFVYLDLGVVSKSAAAGRACSTNSYAPFFHTPVTPFQPIHHPPKPGIEKILDLEKISRGNGQFFSILSWRIKFSFLEMFSIVRI